ncbi:piggyBac transposable element-derived protein 3-like [Phymastichus coffea]|uniref:piggyBac transposable element-derived protein 3-like n=1 Tax=Phymastichus coffea TaxID=108790 RepID=UPI00273C5809|nr:piggyBac transposable element-derived protein 3-like [Phymastichus coffea]
MTRDRFGEIKTKIKYSKLDDKNDNDKAWKFTMVLSVDEMMLRFFGRTCLKQYLPCKPDRYDLKLWGLCGTNGYIFNMDIYCGRNDTSIGINLAKCPLGSRVVLQMINPLLLGLSKRKLLPYHFYIDNYFTSPDLVVYLNKYGLRSTGTVRKDRVKEKHIFEKKEVSVLSRTVSFTPIQQMKRYSRTVKDKTEIGFPFAFSLYNKFVGGVDLRDFRCKKASPSKSSKKWTFKILLRIIEASITNALTLWNICNDHKSTHVTTKDLCKEVNRMYRPILNWVISNPTSMKLELERCVITRGVVNELLDFALTATRTIA